MESFLIGLTFWREFSSSTTTFCLVYLTALMPLSNIIK